MEGSPAGRIGGFYIASGHWLDAEYGPGELHKVGHTGDLGRRLHDDAYVTNFPEGHWRYAATLETATKEEAFLLETAVLYCCRARRLGSRELVRMPAAELAALAADIAAELGIAVVRRERPEYPAPRAAPRSGEAAPGGAERGPSEPTAWAAARPRVERLTVGPAVERPLLPCAPLDLSDLIDDLLTWEPAPAPAPQPAAAPADLAPAPAGEAGSDESDDDAVDQARADLGSPFDLREAPRLELRDYQREAADRCLEELRASGRAILQMACRCGKTPVAYEVARDYLGGPAGGPVLFLVPGLALLRQTAQKLAAYGCAAPLLLVGSDPRPVVLGAPAPGGAPRELAMTTEPAEVRAFLAPGGPRVVLSTYQSSAQALAGAQDVAFRLTVFDEAHRVCGGRAARPFNAVVLAPRGDGARLFMTATPAYDPPGPAVITMKDRELFGGVAYRYHLRRGVEAGHVNDFRLEVVAAPAAADPEAALPAQIAEAMRHVGKLLVFCRNIAHAARLCEALRAAEPPAGVEPFECLTAHSRMGPGGAAAALRRFAAPGVRAVLTNCRLFQEGVEIPELNGVFFAAPRHAPRDIIQSVCRPLNALPGKPPSVVFLPVSHDPGRPLTDPANLRRYASIVPFIDALLSEDGRLFEYMLDPTSHPYPMHVLGTHSLGMNGDAQRAALLAAIRRVVRHGPSVANRPVERLLRVEALPWQIGFAELRRVVTSCNRYPKTTDALVLGTARICLHRFYRWAAEEYVALRDGRPTKLEPHQVHDLESLPEWRSYGVSGPYPARECLDFLERWLREHDGVPPMTNIKNGGYIGLDATPHERLAGFLTTCNQADGSAHKGRPPGSGFTLSTDKQAELARICGPYGLRWRKERDADGAIIKDGPQTFIQEAYARFKAHVAEHGVGSAVIQEWYPLYPHKHRCMESPEVHAKKLAPPRIRPVRKGARLAPKDPVAHRAQRR